MATFASVDDYAETIPAAARPAFDATWAALRAGLPGAEEGIRYNVPTLLHDGRSVVHLAAWKKYLSVYPDPGDTDPDLAAALTPYRAERATLRFPLNQPVPLALITRITEALSTR